MSGLQERLKDLNEVESPESRIEAALSRLPAAGCCRFILEDGTPCRRRRVRGRSWCESHAEICRGREHIGAQEKRLVALLHQGER
jgi:hypothetical protein